MMNLLGDRLRKTAGLSETGRGLHGSSSGPVPGAVELVEFMQHGGRPDPPASFPVVYFSEDSRSCRRALTSP